MGREADPARLQACGGFCLWSTATTGYNISNTLRRGGKGDMVKEVADAAAGTGSRWACTSTRMTRAMRRASAAAVAPTIPRSRRSGPRSTSASGRRCPPCAGRTWVNEIWLDGGCVIDIHPVIDRSGAPNAVLFAGTRRDCVRWVGNERGIAPDVNWNTLKAADIAGVNGAGNASDPDGDLWAPVECDTTLYDHNWFWNAGNEARRKSLDHLMHLFVKSAGNGSVLLLNSTPDTSGAIPAGDLKRYAEFGEAIERNFGRPLGKTAGAVAGDLAECRVEGAGEVNCADIREDYRLGHRIREFVVEGKVGGTWRRLASGEAVGRRKLVFFPPVKLEALRVRVTRAVGTPVIRLLQAHRVDDALAADLVPPLSQGCAATASSIHSAPYAAGFMVDGNPGTRWGTVDGDRDPWLELDLGRPRKIAHAAISELADRVKKFRIEVRNQPDEAWRVAYEGARVGAKAAFDFERVTARYVRFHVLEYAGPGVTFWEWKLRDRPDALERAGDWRGGRECEIDLSTVINEAALYELHFVDAAGAPVKVESARLLFDGVPAEPVCLGGVGEPVLRVNRTQAIGPGASSRIFVRLTAPAGAEGRVLIK
ncbi:MAG: discoidin domain-containing protein [Kiritimatiellia bacterium]